MKLKWVFLELLFAVLLLASNASTEKKKKFRRKAATETISRGDVNIVKVDETFEAVETLYEKSPSLVQDDPCQRKHCGAGRICQLTQNRDPTCVCIEKCDEESNPRRRVCTNYNETFGSDCEVYQTRCFCDTNDSRCKSTEYKHIHIEYYGECKQMPVCKQEDKIDFPRRMRDWLFNIMRDLADRQELPHYYVKMQREAESNYTLRWSNAAIWKWCDLDGYPHDRAVSRHELFPIRAPLMALEHCIAPFLDSCDSDNDHKITLKEWGKCLELKEDDLEEQCDHLAEITDE